jgi:chromosome segregation ATPase
VRAESASLRDRVEEMKAQIKDREDQVAAHDRVADELRDELQQTRNELNRARGELGDMAESMAARERQAARALEDTAKLREDMDDKNRQLMELSRTKDEGWKKLNDQLTEIEHLREVINEQERMLEERRVGLISQEEVIKELRVDKEKSLKSIAQLRAERDSATTNASRNAAQINGLEEENRRLGRLLVEAQTDSGRGGAQPDHLMKMTGDIRELRVELKKVEADRERLEEQYKRADLDREKLEGRLAQIEVELQEAQHGRMAAESARNVAQDALAKAEVARHKAAEESLNLSKARDVASTGGDDARRELDRLRRKVAELEKAPAAAAPAIDPKELQLEREASERKLKDAIEKAAAAERSLKSLQAEVDAAKTDAAKARAEAARAKAAVDAHAESVLDGGAAPVKGELARAAQEVYESINDILSEMRNNMILVQGELPNLKADALVLQAVGQAVEALVDNAETAKGALRGLRDLANGG